MKKEYVSRGRLLIAVAVIMLSMVFACKPVKVFAATSGAISSVSNISDGIKVKWNKDTTKKGYYIYRKVDAGEWRKVKEITDNQTTSWVDKQVYAGSQYTYKVAAFKGTKIYDNSVTRKIYRLKTPSLTLTSMSAGAFYAVTGYSNYVSGYQIKYSTSKSFTNYKIKTVSGVTGLKQTVDGLSVNKTYYVKVRAFKKIGTKTYYSGYTSTKSVTTKNTKAMYTTSNFTSLYTKTDSSSKYKANVMPPYNSKVTYYGPVESYDSGKWIKLKYDGIVYYMWQSAGEKSKLTSQKSTFTYTTSNKFQKSVVDLAVDIAKNWETEYVKGKVGETNSKGVHGFDCSGYVSYVLNTAMQKYVPTYDVSSNVQTLYKTKAIYNSGYSNTFSTKVVCSGTYNQSKLQPGDVIFFKEQETSSKEIDHCALYLGKGEFAECTKMWKGVIINPMSDFYKECFVKAIRMIPSTVKPANDTLYVKTPKTCNVYASTSSTPDNVLDTIRTEDAVTLLYSGTTGTWCYVSYNKDGVKKNGYILSSKLSKTPPVNLGETRYIKKFSQKIYTDTTTSSASVTLYCTDKLTYDGRLGTGNYYKVRYQGKRYYIYSKSGIDQYLSKSLQDIYNGIGKRSVTEADGTNIYATADTDSEKIHHLNKGDVVTVLAYSSSGNWAYIQYGSYRGFVLTKKFS